MSLSAKKQQAALLIAMGQNQKNVAQALKITEKTLSTWKQNDEFCNLLNRNSEDLMAELRLKILPFLKEILDVAFAKKDESSVKDGLKVVELLAKISEIKKEEDFKDIKIKLINYADMEKDKQKAGSSVKNPAL